MADTVGEPGDETTVAWTMIERGWQVLAASGDKVGEVFWVLGDENADIFDGLEVAQHSLGGRLVHRHVDRPRYVPAEQVASIHPGMVRLHLSADDAARLPLSDVPVSLRILPETASRRDRIETEIQHLEGEGREG